MDDSNDWTFECNICFHEKNCNQDQFPITCCKNFLCRDCSIQLVKPECPFCRVFIKSLEKKTIKKEISFLDFHLDSFNDETYYSRIYRRKRKQLLKLQQREENYLKNRDAIRPRKPDYRKYFNRELRYQLNDINT